MEEIFKRLIDGFGVINPHMSYYCATFEENEFAPSIYYHVAKYIESIIGPKHIEFVDDTDENDKKIGAYENDTELRCMCDTFWCKNFKMMVYIETRQMQPKLRFQSIIDSKYVPPRWQFYLTMPQLFSLWWYDNYLLYRSYCAELTQLEKINSGVISGRCRIKIFDMKSIPIIITKKLIDNLINKYLCGIYYSTSVGDIPLSMRTVMSNALLTQQIKVITPL